MDMDENYEEIIDSLKITSGAGEILLANSSFADRIKKVNDFFSEGRTLDTISQISVNNSLKFVNHTSNPGWVETVILCAVYDGGEIITEIGIDFTLNNKGEYEVYDIYIYG